jgi:CheY-like chemotaxis protein
MQKMENKLNCILLVDDDIATNFINKKIIQKADIIEHIQVALNGKEALEYLCNKGKFESIENKYPQPQLILLDINMPVMDGWEFIETYRDSDIPNKENIVIVMLSSSFNPADKAKAESIPEISEFRQKPMSKEALLQIIAANFPELTEEIVV